MREQISGGGVFRVCDKYPSGDLCSPTITPLASADSPYRPITMIRSIVFSALLCMPLVMTAADAPPRVRPTTWAQPVIGTTLENLHHVSPEIYRSAQPSNKELRMLCEQLGVKSVLTLRNWHDDKDEGKDLPLTLYRVNMEADEVDPVKVAQALKIIAEAPKPMLIHCWHGADRTGLMIAAYRITTQGWDPAQATDELINGGFGYHASLFPGIAEWLRSGALVPAVPATTLIKPKTTTVEAKP